MLLSDGLKLTSWILLDVIKSSQNIDVIKSSQNIKIVCLIKIIGVNIKMLIRKYNAFLLAVFLMSSHHVLASDLAQTLVNQGNGKGAIACVACHGADGGGQEATGFPRLAGLNPAYLEKQLYDFNTSKRSNPIMSPIAKAMSRDEIKAISSYYSTMKLPSAIDKPLTNETLMQEGKKLAENGNWSKEIPACFACHGAKGNGIGDNFPALAGQHAIYTAQQIQAWKSGQRDNDPKQLMKVVANRMSDAEIKAVSAYLASLVGVER